MGAMRSMKLVGPLELLALAAIAIGMIARGGLSATCEPSFTMCRESIPAGAPIADAVVSVGFTVSDLDRALDFYTTVLPFERVSETEVASEWFERLTGVFGSRARIAVLRLGDQRIRLTQYLAPEGRPIPIDSRSNDRWFQHIAIVVSDMDAAYKHLRRHGVRHASSGPQRLPDWNPNAGGISAFYFKDFDGHVLEVIHFPPGKGDPRWEEEPSGRLFLGIDHTAIVVRDTEASLRFYRDVLGFSVAGGAENYGTEQEHLNNVFGARLRITGLKAPRGGIGVEFLEYLAPSDGREQPYPGQRPAADNDLLGWHISVSTTDAAGALDAMKQADVGLVSGSVVGVRDAGIGLAQGLRVRDPDGHVIELGQSK